MTVKSPFYNKPSTSTSVDSCHKCPLILPALNNVSTTAKYLTDRKDQQRPVGFDQSMVSVSSNNISPIEPSNSSVAESGNERMTATSCSNCGTSSTPLWRRSPLGHTICNACGLYLKTHNTLRPAWMEKHLSTAFPRQEPPLLAPLTHKRPVENINKSVALDSVCNNCRTTKTPLWRRDRLGKTICNACGLYYKLHNVHRPIGMKNSTIRRRNRTHPSKVGVHKMIYEKPSSDKKESYRPLLPSPEPNEIQHYSKNSIACLLNPELDARPHLPSPPHSNNNLDFEAHRNELKRKVGSLTTLLNHTNAILLNIDQFIAKN